MTPAARLQSAIEILGALNETALPADRFIRDWFRMRRYAGSKDRAAVAERVFAILRHSASLAWRMGSDAPRALAIASVLGDGDDVEALFGGEGYGPAPLSETERAAILSPQPAPPPLPVQGEFPAWLEGELVRSLGERLLPEMHAMGERASVDLRANTLKASRDDVLRELREQGFAAEPTPYAPDGIRIASGEKLSLLGRSATFEQGKFEFQDEAAQIAALLCGATPGERILDLAAGAGGKALALAAAMGNRGEIVAWDTELPRLTQLEPRALRAGAPIIAAHRGDAPPQGPFDAVFVDAPCSGSGSWRRQPENKWRLTPARLAELTATQDSLLDQAAARANGRIVYATCSLLNCENEERVTSFLSRHANYQLRPAADVWNEVTNRPPPPPGMGDCFKASPHTTQTDGFFTAIFVRKA